MPDQNQIPGQGKVIMGPSVGRRHKSTVRGAQLQPLDYINGQVGGLKRNNSKP